MPPYRIEWLDDARADVRALDRSTAMRIFQGVLHFARSGSGDVGTLQGDLAGAFRPRLGDYRVLFTLIATVREVVPYSQSRAQRNGM